MKVITYTLRGHAGVMSIVAQRRQTDWPGSFVITHEATGVAEMLH